MDLSFVNLAIGGIVTVLFYFITSVIIREVGEFVVKVNDNTFFKASKVAGVLSALIFLQFLLGSVWYLQEIILALILIALFAMTHWIYDLDWKEASIMAGVCIAVYVVLILLLAGIIFLTA
ncbi:MAG: hypothetical protein ACMXX5_00545 [Candidatus Woesearchaeota archaeon]